MTVLKHTCNWHCYIVEQFLKLYQYILLINKMYYMYIHKTFQYILFALIPIQAQTCLTTLVKGLVIELLQVGDIEPCGASYILIINISGKWGHNTKMIKNIFNKLL